MHNPKLIRITTVPLSLNVLLKGQLKYMKAHFDVLAVAAGPQEELDAVGSREGVPTRWVEMTRAITPLQDLKAVWQLYKIFKKEKPLIVHTHTPKAGIVGMLAAKLAGVPHRLHTVAGLPLLEATGTKRKLLDFVEKLTYRCATKVYPNSKGLYDIIIKQGYIQKNVIASKAKLIANGSSNGIDTIHFSPEQVSPAQKEQLRQELGISPQDFVFIFIGRLVGDKGINELVAAFASHCERNSTESHSEPQQSWGEGVSSGRHSERSEGASSGRHSERSEGASSGTPKLVLVGPLEPHLDPLTPETISTIDQNPNIITTGFQNDVRPFLAISDALVFPSYREGFPNVVMQAGAMGLPAIVTNINGCNEIIIESKNGTIIPAKSGTSPSKPLQQALETAMHRFMEDKAWYNQLQQNARPMICDRYEQKVVWEALLEEYEGLISGGR